MKLRSEQQRFVYRVAGVVAHDGRVLAHEDDVSDFWVLPGGSCELGEDSTSCLRRELREELDAEVQVGRLVLARSRSASTSCGVTASYICKVTVLHGRAVGSPLDKGKPQALAHG